MKGTQIPKLAGAIVEHQEAFLDLLEIDEAQALIRETPEFIRIGCDAWKKHLQERVIVADQLAEWNRFYSEIFGFDENVPINPVLPANLGWLIVVPVGLKLNRVLEVMRKHMTVYSHLGDDLDTVVPTNDRPTTKDYAISVRNRIEADEENKNLSANQITAKGIKGVTLLERLVLELFYFWKKQEAGETDLNKMHLDVKNVTLCSGSRGLDGDVPSVGWHSGNRKVYIFWYDPGYSDDYVRTRAVQLAARAA